MAERGRTETLRETFLRVRAALDELAETVGCHGRLEPPHRSTELASRPLPLARAAPLAPFVSIEQTRGGRLSCDDCPIPAHDQRSFRRKGGDRVARETHAFGKAALRLFLGTDGSFFDDREGAAEIVETVARHRHDVRGEEAVVWRRGTEATLTDPPRGLDLVPSARLSGMQAVWSGIEDLTGSLVRKGQSAEETEAVFRALLAEGIMPMPMPMLIHSDDQPAAATSTRRAPGWRGSSRRPPRAFAGPGRSAGARWSGQASPAAPPSNDRGARLARGDHAMRRAVNALTMLLVLAGPAAAQQAAPKPAQQQPAAQKPPIVIFRIDLVPAGSAFAMNEPVLEGDVYVFRSLPERTLERLPKARVKQIVQRSKDFDKEVIWQVELQPAGRILTYQEPVLKGRSYNVRSWKGDTLVSVRLEDVKKISKLTGLQAYRAEEEELGVRLIDGEIPDGAGTGSARSSAPPAAAGQPAPGAQPGPQGNWVYQGQPGVTDAYAPPNAVVDQPGGVPKAPPTPR